MRSTRQRLQAHWAGTIIAFALALGTADIAASAYSATAPGQPVSLVSTATPTFADVPFDHPYYAYIEALYRAGYTAGCGAEPLRYCPNQTMNRAESAVFVERGIHTSSYTPPESSSQVFADLPLDSWAAGWVNGLWEDGYAAGCGTNPLLYCPWQGHTRAEGAVFYLRMMRGADFVPEPPTSQVFADVPPDAWYAGWVHAAYAAGLIPACETAPELRFCPADPLSRGLAAYMMVQAKGLPPPPGPGCVQPGEMFRYDETRKRLTISTCMMEVAIEGGAIVYARDAVSGEVFVDTSPWGSLGDFWTNPDGAASGFVSRNASGNMWRRRATETSSVSFDLPDPNRGILTYSHLLYDSSGASWFTLGATVDVRTGEILLQLAAGEGDADKEVMGVDIPVINLAKSSVILGNGARYVRSDPEKVDQSSSWGLGLYSPSVGIVEGQGAAFAMWSEDPTFTRDYVELMHRVESDHVVLHAQPDAVRSDRRQALSPIWRLSLHKNWTEAARRWREIFESWSGARPLWENVTPWIRKIHAVYTGHMYGNEARYAELASTVPVDTLLYFLWNGDRIVLFGDHTLVQGIAAPSPRDTELIDRYGWRLMLYHPYDLIRTEAGAQSRLEFLQSKGWLQSGYQFNPDFDGTVETWYTHWSDVNTLYDETGGMYVLHPGSTKFKNYLVRNFPNYASTRHADGAYFDTLGIDFAFRFPPERKVIGGEDFVAGEIGAISRLRTEHPELGVMSEYEAPWLIPYIFYTWEGYTHVNHAYSDSPINHPLRTALLGSYVWTKEVLDTSLEMSALLGTLPELHLVGDYQVSEEQARWSQARARLFCEEELYNDLPPEWDPEALAYYRSGSGHWFKLTKSASGQYAYIEELPDGTEVVRLTQ